MSCTSMCMVAYVYWCVRIDMCMGVCMHRYVCHIEYVECVSMCMVTYDMYSMCTTYVYGTMHVEYVTVHTDMYIYIHTHTHAHTHVCNVTMSYLTMHIDMYTHIEYMSYVAMRIEYMAQMYMRMLSHAYALSLSAVPNVETLYLYLYRYA